jgi:hypothetical protein
MGTWVTSCAGSSDTTAPGDDGSADSTNGADGSKDVANEGVHRDGTVESGSDATAETGDDTGSDTGDDNGDDATGDAGLDGEADGGGDADADADGGADASQYCVGQGGVMVNVTCSGTLPCTPTDGGGDAGACGATSGASYTTCTQTQCSATGNGISYAVACYDDTTCDFGLSGIDFCATCGAGATCTFTDNGSAGSQEYVCAAGSDCTIDIISSSGSRIVDCSQAKKCTVSAFASGETQVSCPADCNVNLGGGINTVCCPTPPIQCQNGTYRCASPDGGDGGGDAGDGGC